MAKNHGEAEEVGKTYLHVGLCGLLMGFVDNTINIINIASTSNVNMQISAATNIWIYDMRMFYLSVSWFCNSNGHSRCHEQTIACSKVTVIISSTPRLLSCPLDVDMSNTHIFTHSPCNSSLFAVLVCMYFSMNGIKQMNKLNMLKNVFLV